MKAISVNKGTIGLMRKQKKAQPHSVYKLYISDLFVFNEIGQLLGSHMTSDEQDYPTIDSPPYQIGDVLYIKETFGNYSLDNPNSNATDWWYKVDFPDSAKGYWYESERRNWCDFPKWRMPIYMPEEAARLFLNVTNYKKVDVNTRDWWCVDMIANLWKYDFNLYEKT